MWIDSVDIGGNGDRSSNVNEIGRFEKKVLEVVEVMPMKIHFWSSVDYKFSAESPINFLKLEWKCSGISSL